MSSAATTTQTGISIGGAGGAQRPVSVTTRTTTTISTDAPSFRQHLDRANMAERCQPKQPACEVTIRYERVGGRGQVQRDSMTDMLRDVRELLEQIYEQLRQQGGGYRARRGDEGQQCMPVTITHRITHCVQPRPAATVPERTFAVKDAANPTGDPTGLIRVRGALAGAPVTQGAKLDEGMRRIDGFLDQVGNHVKNGGTFTDAQLQSIADESLAIYYEAIRPNVSATDVGDYSAPGRDGVLDLGASNQCVAVQASLAAGEPSSVAQAA